MKQNLILSVYILLLSNICSASQDTPPSLSIAGKSEVVYRSIGLNTSCKGTDKWGNKMDVPDAPVRAIRDKSDKTVFFAAHYDNVVFELDSTGLMIKENCNSVLSSGESPNVKDYTDREWLVSAYTNDGKSIFGLVHNEYWGGSYDSICKVRLGRDDPWMPVCVFSNLTAAVSKDSAKNFKHFDIDGSKVVASLQYQFSSMMDRAGIRDPSNLFLNPIDRNVYFYAWSDRYKNQKEGLCLFKSENPFTKPWFGYTDNGWFRFKSPYMQGAVEGERLCLPVNNLYISSVVYHAETGYFIGVGQDDRAGGIFFETSKDLLNWSKPSTIIPSKSFNAWRAGNAEPLIYASIIDLNSSSRNYDQIGTDAYIYFIRVKIENDKLASRDREIVRVKVEVK